ncbi:DUF2061 domain-containing protein [Noviherbaspirillum sp. CPCC 100848]|uniref:DUF2061 domain-containing protein n=1 Tax=Noviherbaspirillum album TaxID=3080276 RepID=A0ABU6JBV2_9BURK|nr:DUF2061 domain-containing protein [Noviherbaspirillum sp. CPCC 100848]MEC4720629.1 DUF2061 domain-containing protein [Noviherbaspirillum sp. CPCC 100848]
MVIAAKTVSQIIVHMAVAFVTMYVVTGSIAFGGLAALLEPICNVIVMPFHEKLWVRIQQWMEARKQAGKQLSGMARNTVLPVNA